MQRGTGSVIAVIPARYASSRLPGKPILKDSGKYLIQHVYEQTRKCKLLDRVLVATDDDRILKAVQSFGGEAVMTSPHAFSGTDRVAEAVRDTNCVKVINVQGDEPEIDPSFIEILIGLLDTAEMATLATPFTRPADAQLSSRVKVVMDRHHHALYFSRSLIPHAHGSGGGVPPLLHVGMYGYTKTFLMQFVTLDRTPLEQAEHLEQLRALEHGYKIKVGVVPWASAGGIDTPEDYAAFLHRLKEQGA